MSNDKHEHGSGCDHGADDAEMERRFNEGAAFAREHGATVTDAADGTVHIEWPENTPQDTMEAFEKIMGVPALGDDKLTGDDLLHRIVETLAQADGPALADFANKVLTEQVAYVEAEGVFQLLNPPETKPS